MKLSARPHTSNKVLIKPRVVRRQAEIADVKCLASISFGVQQNPQSRGDVIRVRRAVLRRDFHQIVMPVIGCHAARSFATSVG